nr:ankyrin-1-like [Ziziphus jujuba var. spinosa]
MDIELYRAAIDGRQDLCEAMRGRGSNHEQETRGEKNTVLHIATKSGKLQIAEEDDHHPALRFLYYQNTEGNTPLHIAARSGHVEMARILVVRARRMDNVQQNKKLVSMRNKEENTALHEAVCHNRFAVVKLLIDEDPNLASLLNSSNESPLFMAVHRSFYDVAKIILNTAAANCSYQGRSGMNVMYAAAIHFALEIFNIPHESLRMLMEEADILGWIPLHYAAHADNREFVELFLNVNKSLAYAKNKKALHVAAESRNDDAVKFLLESFAYQDLINKKDNKRNTALHLAAASAQGQGDLNILEIMLTNDSDIDRWARNKDGMAFSHIILSNKQLEGVEISTTIMSELEREIASIRLEQSEGDEEKAEQKQQKDGHHQEPEVKQRDYKELASLNLVISTLIATITFGPVIQMPGGYDPNGFAVHGGKRSFLAFLILDSLAF